MILERVFANRAHDVDTWKKADPEAARLLWEARTERIKLSDFAEEVLRCLADHKGHAMLLRKGELYRLVELVDPVTIPQEVGEKLDLLAGLFENAAPGEEA